MVGPPSPSLSAKAGWRLVPANSSEPENTEQDSIKQTNKQINSVGWVCEPTLQTER
jgi:hypothetical protein